jgi:cytochrome c556
MRKSAWMGMIAGGLLLGGMAAGEAGPPSLQLSMKQVLIPQAQIIWNTSNRALDDNGGIDAGQLAPADWKRIGGAAERLEERAKALVGARPLTVAAPGEVVEGGGTATLSLAQVQALVDARPEAFDAQLRAFADTAAKLGEAAKARDAAALGVEVDRLNQACEACHQEFWYPPEAAPEGREGT